MSCLLTPNSPQCAWRGYKTRGATDCRPLSRFLLMSLLLFVWCKRFGNIASLRAHLVMHFCQNSFFLLLVLSDFELWPNNVLFPFLIFQRSIVILELSHPLILTCHLCLLPICLHSSQQNGTTTKTTTLLYEIKWTISVFKFVSQNLKFIKSFCILCILISSQKWGGKPESGQFD